MKVFRSTVAAQTVSNMSLMAQLTVLKYFSRKDFDSGNGNSDAGAL